ncbi:MAG: GNAT family N-acetyltransferase [Chloroflexi bacterium]|nr:GNAT family N-acetyltransferase [Chloroflexota bacterium]
MQHIFNLRAATANDAKTIRALVIEGRINFVGLDWNRFVVAESEAGEVVGCGQLKPHRDGSVELASIVVTPKWRSRGVARAIIEHLITAHDGALYLLCQSSLGSMYEKFGFETLDPQEMPKFFRRVSKLAGLTDVLRQRGETLLVMRRF